MINITDDDLTYKHHINQVSYASKISKMTGITAKARHFVFFSQKCDSIIQCYIQNLLYSYIRWTSTYPIRVQPIFSCKKRYYEL